MTIKHGIGKRFGFTARTALVLCLTLLSAGLAMAQSTYPPLDKSHFTSLIGPMGSEMGEGFNDRQNSWAWSMLWFKGKLYVGTNRAQECVNAAAIHIGDPALQAYPPVDPDISCDPDYTNLPLQAEIWSWDPATSLWTEVYQAPADVPIPNTNPVKYVSRDIGYRGMLDYTEADGTEALYIGSCSSRAMYGVAVPPGRILRTVDGANFTPIPQDPGTYLGNIGSACFRGSVQFNGKFYGVATNFKGSGILIESANPQLGNNSFRQVSPFGQLVYEFAAFNNNLYVSFSSPQGFSIHKTSATGKLPYSYKTIFAKGGYKASHPNQNVVSMKVFNNKLYIGGDGVQSSGTIPDLGAELFRVNADDTWDLLVGTSRNTPNGQKNALSGLDVGFGWSLNEHMWRMEIFDGRLYIGTFDASTVLRNNTSLGPSLTPLLGADLWYTPDGTYFSNVDYQGLGDKFNFGFRSMAATPYGLFVGSANYYYGLELFQGAPAGFTSPTPGAQLAAHAKTFAVPSTPLDAPSGLQLESYNQSALLSWQPSQANASRYRVYRWNTTPVQAALTAVDASGSGEGSQLFQSTGGSTAWQIRGPRESIGTTTNTFFVDSNMTPGASYSYQVVGEDGAGDASGPSNVAGFPSQLPKLKFSDVLALITQDSAQGKFNGPGAQQLVLSLANHAQAEAAKGNFVPLVNLWKLVAGSGSNLLSSDSAQDLATLLERLVGRSELISGGALPVGSL